MGLWRAAGTFSRICMETSNRVCVFYLIAGGMRAAWDIARHIPAKEMDGESPVGRYISHYQRQSGQIPVPASKIITVRYGVRNLIKRYL